MLTMKKIGKRYYFHLSRHKTKTEAERSAKKARRILAKNARVVKGEGLFHVYVTNRK